MVDTQTFERLTTEEFIQLLSDKRKFDTLFDKVTTELTQKHQREQNFRNKLHQLPECAKSLVFKYLYEPAPTFLIMVKMFYKYMFRSTIYDFQDNQYIDTLFYRNDDDIYNNQTFEEYGTVPDFDYPTEDVEDITPPFYVWSFHRIQRKRDIKKQEYENDKAICEDIFNELRLQKELGIEDMEIEILSQADFTHFCSSWT